MLNALDLLVIVVMALAAVSLLAVALMFVLKNEKAKRVCLWLVSGLGVYLAYVGCRINWPGFVPQVVLAVLMGLAAIGAVVLERKCRENPKMQRIAHILSAAALFAGMFNAFM